ncbi:MAG: hypothetical protein GC191_15500 [Azospirillum sp.]|nr:hypothetical protein [Azospirillum sp.]
MTDAVLPWPTGNETQADDRSVILRLVGLSQEGRPDDLIAECEALAAAVPDHPAALYGLALAAAKNGQYDSALAALERAHEISPKECLYPEVLGVLHAQAGQLAGAIYYAKISTALGFDETMLRLLPSFLPNLAHTLRNIGNKPYLKHATAFAEERQIDLAIKWFDQHLAFFPGDAEALRGLIRVLLLDGQFGRSIAATGDLERCDSLTATDRSVLARAFAGLGDVGSARQYHAEALLLAPDDAEVVCASLADAVFYPEQTQGALIGLAQAGLKALGGRRAAEPAMAPDPGRRPRIGFMIGDAWDARDLNVVAAVTRHLNRKRLECRGYGFGDLEDEANGFLQGCFDSWYNLAELDAYTLAAVISGDDLDLLVDIGGWEAPRHIAAMTRRPAPIQVAWLGNPSQWLLHQIDVVLTDLDESWGDIGATVSCRSLPLPHGLYCYAPVEADLLPAPASPETFTFGADVGLAQLHPDLISSWAAILTRVPDARLALRARKLSGPAALPRLVAEFERAGIAERIDLIQSSHDEFYAQTDIALAPFVSAHPHEVATALGNGIPVVAFAGAGRVRRQAATLLRHAGLASFVSESIDGYVELAVALAKSGAARRQAAEAVRAATAASPIFHPQEFAAAFEQSILSLLESPAE